MPTLTWIGKDKVVNHHHDVPYRVLEHKYGFRAEDESDKMLTNSGNKIIHGDNLEALKSLLPEYEGRIKCIYIDPPYNTGNEKWVYNDNVNDPKIKKWLGEVVGKQGEDLSRHDKWLCMMYPRLKLLHKLLAEDGVIFISIDDNEQANLKLLCDEIFGVNNFLTDIIWQHSIQPKGYLGKFSIHHNHTFVFQKSFDFVLGNIERTAEHNKAYKNPDNDPRGAWRPGDVRNALYRPNLIYDIISPSGKRISPPANGWRWSKETVDEKIRTGEIIFNKEETNIIRKIYLSSVEGRAPESIWFGNEVGTTREANTELKNIFEGIPPFDTPKPTKLIDRILQIATNKDSIILDSFAGSGTTAHAVLNLNKKDKGNRKFILVEMEDYAEDITAERVRRVMQGYGEGKNAVAGTGGAFDYYELGERMFDEEQNLNENIGEEKIREYIYYTETKRHLEHERSDASKYLLDTYNATGYYFYYERDRLTTLSIDTLHIVTERAEQYVIYADTCTVPPQVLAAQNITFKKIPRDIKRV